MQFRISTRTTGPSIFKIVLGQGKKNRIKNPSVAITSKSVSVDNTSVFE